MLVAVVESYIRVKLFQWSPDHLAASAAFDAAANCYRAAEELGLAVTLYLRVSTHILCLDMPRANSSKLPALCVVFILQQAADAHEAARTFAAAAMSLMKAADLCKVLHRSITCLHSRIITSNILLQLEFIIFCYNCTLYSLGKEHRTVTGVAHAPPSHSLFLFLCAQLQGDSQQAASLFHRSSVMWGMNGEVTKTGEFLIKAAKEVSVWDNVVLSLRLMDACMEVAVCASIRLYIRIYDSICVCVAGELGPCAG